MKRNYINNAIYAIIILCILKVNICLANQKSDGEISLNDSGRKIEDHYTKQLLNLHDELKQKIPSESEATGPALKQFLASDNLDPKLVKFVILEKAKPRALAEFGQLEKGYFSLLESLFNDPKLMRQMLVADGARAKRMGRKGYGPPQYGKAMEIYSKIQDSCKNASAGIFQRLALAISLEHAVPVVQTNPAEDTNAPDIVDPVKRYHHYKKAYLDGELDPTFKNLSTWDLRMVVNGDEPDETLAWGREMLRNYRPDHIYNENFGWRYVAIVGSDVKYGSGDVKYDRPELQKYQNILMNGGVCGRRAFIGRFILRAFGVPTTARPSRGHAALAHWTPGGWCVNLGGGWGAGWTSTQYDKDVDFLASSQARNNPKAYLQVKRAQWIGDVMGEERVYGENSKIEPKFWNAIALRIQKEIIKELKAVTLDALGEDIGEANEPTVAEKIIASPVTPKDKEISVTSNGRIKIPSAAYSKPSGNTREVLAMKSFDGGMQIYLPRFFPQGKTIMRGGTWKGDANACTSGKRMLSDGYGRYENWGLRAAITPKSNQNAKELELDLGDGVTMEFVYIKPGNFVMGGENKTDGRFQCVEVPKHKVELTKGFYLGKYEVTQAQFESIMGSNPSKSTKSADCPVDNVSEDDARKFCLTLSERTGVNSRLPTEAEWEFASRAGKSTQWFFGDDGSKIGDYAWFKGNAGGKSHPVGQKKPNQWGLYDIYGNVCERISDKYARNYYSISPKVDPTGPSQGSKSHMEYTVTAPNGGKYFLDARVVTANYNQQINVSVNQNGTKSLVMPFTKGSWQKSKPVEVSLNKGKNTLAFWRDQPPQYGLAIKEFTLKPIK